MTNFALCTVQRKCHASANFAPAHASANFAPAHASANFAPCIVHATLVRNLLCSATPHEIFSFLFFDVNSFLILVTSQSQALLL